MKNWHTWVASAAALMTVLGGISHLGGGDEHRPRVEATGTASPISYPPGTELAAPFKGHWSVRIANNSREQAEDVLLKPEQGSLYEVQVDEGTKSTGTVNGPMQIGTLLPGSVADVEVWSPSAPEGQPTLRLAHKQGFDDVVLNQVAASGESGSDLTLSLLVLALFALAAVLKLYHDLRKGLDEMSLEIERLGISVDVAAESIAALKGGECRATPLELSLALKVPEETVLAAIRLLELRGIIEDLVVSPEGYLNFKRTSVPWTYPLVVGEQGLPVCAS